MSAGEHKKKFFKSLKISKRNLLKSLFGLPFIFLVFHKNKSAPVELKSTVIIDLNKTNKNVNRKVIGACLMLTPFKNNYLKLAELFGSKTSARLWPGNLTDVDFDEKKELIKWLNPYPVLAFLDRSQHPNERIHYLSAEKNNLETFQKPDKVIQDLKWVLSRLESIGYPSKGKYLYWEAWNEPQHPQNGAWDAAEFGKYVNDIALRVKKAQLPVKVGAPLHMDDHNWNVQLCKSINNKLIDFLVTHYYGFWEYTAEPRNDFLARAGFSTVLRQRVKKDIALVNQYGGKRWTLHCSEWNLHPKRYQPPYESTTDIAAAMFALSAVKIFLEEGVESAQFFLISSQEHFGAISIDNNGTISLKKTGLIFKLMNQFLHGKLLNLNIVSSKYLLKVNEKDKLGNSALNSYSVPYIDAIGCLVDEKTIKILLCNKSDLSSSEVKIKGFLPNKKKEVQLSIFKSTDRSEDLDPSNIVVSNKSDVNIVIPEKSIAAITVKL